MLGPCSSSADLLRIVTPDEYRSRISDFAKLETGEGEIHEALAEYLESEPSEVNKESFAGIPSNGASEKPFLRLYELSLDQPAGLKARGPDNDLNDFQTPDEFYEKGPVFDQENKAQILFLRGHPSPRWLKAIGSKYKLEPDFLAKHLDFLNPPTAEDVPLVGLPTSLAHVVQLCITTIGSRDCENRFYKQEEVDSIRKQDKADMTLYSSELSKGQFRVGDPIVRHYSTLNERFFAIEQKVSIHIQNYGKSWIGKSDLA
ncbi:MAG: hypothetical protein Q9164_007697 [Protoblastenia rupestris]